MCNKFLFALFRFDEYRKPQDYWPISKHQYDDCKSDFNISANLLSGSFVFFDCSRLYLATSWWYEQTQHKKCFSCLCELEIKKIQELPDMEYFENLVRLPDIQTAITQRQERLRSLILLCFDNHTTIGILLSRFFVAWIRFCHSLIEISKVLFSLIKFSLY